MANVGMLNAVAAVDMPLGKQLAEGPRGKKPKKRFSRGNIIVYGTLFVVALYYALPLYVMIVTSLKGMPEIRMGNIFAPPLEITFEPWVKAWKEACTGINCDGLSRGFWNSVRILIPSVILSVAIASVNGYALLMWKFRGSEVFFTILMIGAFIPYQVMLYPIVILLREAGLYGSLTGLVLVHVAFGMPINTLLFRNYFASIPEELFKAARVDGAGFLGDLLQDHPADVAADLCRGLHHSGHGHLERLPVRRDLHLVPRPLSDDGAAEQYRQLGAGGEGIQRQHGRDTADRPRPARHLLCLRQAFRPWHRCRRGKRIRL